MFVDFDGTISAVDVGKHLLKTLGRDGWEEPDQRFLLGEIGSRERIEAQWRCLPRNEALLRETAGSVPLDPGFGPLVEALKSHGADVAVVSDGFGFYVEAALSSFGLRVVTNSVDFASGSVLYANLDPECPCSLCGTCKRAPVLEAKRQGRTTVFVGDGISDSKGALAADHVFAKSRLAEWCERQRVAFTPFSSLSDVQHALVPRSPAASTPDRRE